MIPYREVSERGLLGWSGMCCSYERFQPFSPPSRNGFLSHLAHCRIYLFFSLYVSQCSPCGGGCELLCTPVRQWLLDWQSDSHTAHCAFFCLAPLAPLSAINLNDPREKRKAINTISEVRNISEKHKGGTTRRMRFTVGLH